MEAKRGPYHRKEVRIFPYDNRHSTRGRTMRARYRLTHTQRLVLDVLRSNPQISYDGLAEQAEIDRRTAMQAIRRLVRFYRVVMVSGRGRVPNRYLVTERLIIWPPSYYRPEPVVLTPEKRAALVEQWHARMGLAYTSEGDQAELCVGDDS